MKRFKTQIIELNNQCFADGTPKGWNQDGRVFKVRIVCHNRKSGWTEYITFEDERPTIEGAKALESSQMVQYMLAYLLKFSPFISGNWDKPIPELNCQ